MAEGVPVEPLHTCASQCPACIALRARVWALERRLADLVENAPTPGAPSAVGHPQVGQPVVCALCGIGPSSDLGLVMRTAGTWRCVDQYACDVRRTEKIKRALPHNGEPG